MPMPSLPMDSDLASLLSSRLSMTAAEVINSNSDVQSFILPDLDENLKFQIDRPVFNQEILDAKFQFTSSEWDSFNLKMPKLGWKKIGEFAKSLFPPISWIPKYEKSWILKDLLVGLTISVLSIPQAMAYATLANVAPVIGLYTSLFPTILYAFFGTSKHIVFGMFAVPALMVGAIVEDLNPENSTLTDPDAHMNESIIICTTITFCLGIIFVLMAFLQLHSLTSYLSDSLVSGFTTAASIHVLSSQIPKLLAVKVGRHDGFFRLGWIVRDMIAEISTTNIPDLMISLVCITILMFGRYLINPKIVPKIKTPIPFELFIVIASTACSYFFLFEKNFNVRIVAKIPTGFPTPKLPELWRIPIILPRAAPIAVVIFGITVSVGKLFAKKHDYKYSAAQDLRAIGFIHVVVSLLQCHPGSGSLTRGSLASACGAKSQLTAVVSALVTLIVVLWLGPLLYHLPICVLACIIFVALQGMFTQFKVVPNLWRISKIDFLIWFVAFLSTFLWDVSQGLLIAVGFSLFTIILRTQIPKTVWIGRLPETELYRDLKKYGRIESIPKIMLLRFDAPLLFVNCERFVENAITLITENQEESKNKEKTEIVESQKSEDEAQKFLILDASSVAQIDQMGVESIKELHNKTKKLEITLLIAAPKSPVRDLFAACKLFEEIPKSRFFPTVHDAVLYVQNI